MKRILLGTTMLIGAASLAAAAHADTPKITLGGVADFQMGYAGSQDVKAADARSGAFRSDTEITLNIDGKTDGGLGYGGFIALEADASQDADQSSDSEDNASRTYLYVDSKAFGRVQMGSDYGVTNTMKVDASSIARATGGIDGAFTYFFNTTSITLADNLKVIATPDLILDYGFDGTVTEGAILGDESAETANKVSYYSPKFMGAQLGASYVFDDDNKGQTVGTGKSGVTGEASNIIELGATWEGKFSNVGINLGAAMERGHAQVTTDNDLRTWQAGAKLSYMGFSVAGSYGDWGDSLRAKSVGKVDADFYTLGAAYETGPFGVSVTWFDSTYEASTTADNTFDNLSVGVDYKLAPGFTPYAEVSLVDMDVSNTSTADVDNEATVFIVGSTLAF